MDQKDSMTNPWPSLSSYQDPLTSQEKRMFCGRDKESFDVSQLVDNHILLTLYGRCGIGKTSLLNAGVTPLLRQKGYIPVSIRLGMEAVGESLQQSIIRNILTTVEAQGSLEELDTVPMSEENTIDYLWRFFARHRFLGNQKQVCFPVVILDQFEEVFRKRRKDAEILLRQVSFLMDETHVLNDRILSDGSVYTYDFNFRFVFSIREDDLYLLEDAIDKNYLFEMKNNRYRLHSLTEDEAREAILIPGKGLFLENQAEQIASILIGISREGGDDSISTNILSLVASRLFLEAQNIGTSHITLSMVNKFVDKDPFRLFYQETMSEFTSAECSYIEDNLVDSEGRRDSVPESDFLLHVKRGSILYKDGNRRFLQRSSASSNGDDWRIELIHDSFCAPLLKLRMQRLKRKKRLLILATSLIVTLSVTVSFFAVFQWYKANQNYWELNKTKAKFVSERVLKLFDGRKKLVTEKLMLEVLPQNLSHPNFPYTEEAEFAFRKVMDTPLTSLEDIIGFDNIKLVSESRNGQLLAASTKDDHNEKLVVWDLETGLIINNIEVKAVSCIALSSKGNLLAYNTDNKDIIICNSSTLSQITVLPTNGRPPFALCFSPDDHFLAIAQSGVIQVRNVNTWRTVQTIPIGNRNGCYIKYSDDGKFLLAVLYPQTVDGDVNEVQVWDSFSGKLLSSFYIKKGMDLSLDFSPDGKSVAYGDLNGFVHVLNTSNGKKLNSWQAHKEAVTNVVFHPNGNSLASASFEDETIKVWNVVDGKEKKSFPVLKPTYISFSHDGLSILYNGSIGWDILDTSDTDYFAKLLGEHDDNIYSILFNINGSLLMTQSQDHTIKLWNGDDYHLMHVFTGDIGTFSPDGKMMAYFHPQGDIKIWDMNTNRENTVAEIGSQHMPTCLFFTPDGNKLIWKSDDNCTIWNIRESQPFKSIYPNKGYSIGDVKLSTDGQLLTVLNTNMDGNHILKVYDGVTTKHLYDQKISKTDYVFRPKSHVIAVALGQGMVEIIDLDSRKIKMSNKGLFPDDGNAPHPWPIKYNHKGDILSVLSYGGYKNCNADKGEIISRIDNSKLGHFNFSFSFDDNYFVTSNERSDIDVYNTVTGKKIASMQCNEDKSFKGYDNSPIFSPDNRKIIFSFENKVYLWDFPPLQELIDKAINQTQNIKLSKRVKQDYYLD